MRKANIAIIFVLPILLVSMHGGILANDPGGTSHGKRTDSASFVDSVNPFSITTSSGSNNYSFFLRNSSYFVDMAPVGLENGNFSIDIHGFGYNKEMIIKSTSRYSEIVLPKTGEYNFNVVGEGKWVVSRDAQDPATLYSFHLNNDTTFSMVPNIGDYKSMTISLSGHLQSQTSNMVTVYSSMLKAVSFKVNKNNSISVNLNGSNDQIMFVYIRMNGELNIYWTGSNHYIPTSSQPRDYIDLLIVVGAVAVAGALIYLRPRGKIR